MQFHLLICPFSVHFSFQLQLVISFSVIFSFRFLFLPSLIHTEYEGFNDASLLSYYFSQIFFFFSHLLRLKKGKVWYHDLNVLMKLIFWFFLFSFLFRSVPTAHGGSQSMGRIRAIASGLWYSHSNTRSKAYLWPTPQLTPTPHS